MSWPNRYYTCLSSIYTELVFINHIDILVMLLCNNTSRLSKSRSPPYTAQDNVKWAKTIIKIFSSSIAFSRTGLALGEAYCHFDKDYQCPEFLASACLCLWQGRRGYRRRGWHIDRRTYCMCPSMVWQPYFMVDILSIVDSVSDIMQSYAPETTVGSKGGRKSLTVFTG